MAGAQRRRDAALIDALEAIAPISYSTDVWRIVREGRDPMQCSRAGGRWDDETFDVLYTSATREGAIAEMRFHLMRGQPVMPSRVSFRLYELSVVLERALLLPDLAALASLGLDISRYGQLSYEERPAEYPRSQDIAETAYFLEFDGLIAPSARFACLNVVPFCNRVAPGSLVLRRDHGPVNWMQAAK